MNKQQREAALQYHRQTPAGKISVNATKPMLTQRDLALAYSPGVASACEPSWRTRPKCRNITARGNLVAVITNGTAVLGLGNIGPLGGQAGDGRQGRAVQEIRRDRRVRPGSQRKRPGQAGRHHRGAGAHLRRHQPGRHQGARNASISKRKLRERMQIPVFHDDQHGTAIIVGAAV